MHIIRDYSGIENYIIVNFVKALKGKEYDQVFQYVASIICMEMVWLKLNFDKEVNY